MPLEPLIESVRLAVLSGLGELGQPSVSLESLRETILIRNGYYAGRRFDCGDLSAVWRAERAEILFFAGDSSPIKVISLETARKAA